ncbi:MAG: transglycosylase SLT domain-containing protein [Candidatus Absconditabacterales bacterium]
MPPENGKNNPDQNSPESSNQQDNIDKTKKEAKDAEKKIANPIIDSKLDDLEKGASGKILDIISGTKMDNDLRGIQNNPNKPIELKDFTVEKFAEEINKPVLEYLKQSFKIDGKDSYKFSNQIINSMSIGIQFAMMEALIVNKTADKNNGSDSNVDFFNGFGNINLTDDFKDSFKGIFGFFSKIGNTNSFYKLANRVENCIIYISNNAGALKDVNCKELNDPNEFRKLLNNSVWDTPEGLSGKTLDQVGISTDGTTVDKAKGEAELKAIADKININEKTVIAIEKALPTASKFLQKRAGYKEKATDLIGGFLDKAGGILDIEIPLVGNLGTLLGINSSDIVKDDSKVLNFVLKIIGFNEGVKGVKKEYMKTKMSKFFETTEGQEAKSIIKQAFESYKKQTNNSDNLATKFKLDDVFKSETTDTQEITEFKNKVLTICKDVDYKNLSDSLIGLKINGNLDNQITSLIGDKSFLKNINNADQLSLAILGNVVIGNDYFGKAIALGAENVSDYGDIKTTENDKTDNNSNEKYDGEKLVFIDKVKENQKEFGKKVVDISQRLGINPNWLMTVMENESGLSPSIINPKSLAVGLIQFLPSTITNMFKITPSEMKNKSNIEQLDFVEKYYEGSKGKINSFTDLYSVTFFPIALGKADDFVFQAKDLSAGIVASQNQGIDLNKDGKITKSEYKQYLKDKVLLAKVPEDIRNKEFNYEFPTA